MYTSKIKQLLKKYRKKQAGGTIPNSVNGLPNILPENYLKVLAKGSKVCSGCGKANCQCGGKIRMRNGAKFTFNTKSQAQAAVKKFRFGGTVQIQGSKFLALPRS